MNISTLQDWWNTVEGHRDQLLKLVDKYHPYFRIKHDHPISAPAAELACQQIRREIASETLQNPSDLFQQYLKNRDSSMVHLLNEVWFGMPESYESRWEPGFGVLCVLCDEAWVFNDEEEAEGE
jgi:hypothetical protein